MKTRFEEICKVTCEDNNKAVDADILDFRQEKMLIVSLNKSIKLTMPWNGKIYEGKLAGKSFVSPGPKGCTYQEGR